MKINIVFFLSILIPMVLITGIIIKNNLPLTDAPGFKKRIINYFTTNVAETSFNSCYPELITRKYFFSANELQKMVEEAVNNLHWIVQERDENRYTLYALAITTLWKFKDNFVIRLQPVENGEIAVYIRSSSSLVRADFGTNTRHIMDFYRQLESLM